MRRIDDRWTERMLEWILKEAANEDPWEYNLFWTPKHYHREKKFKDQLEIKTEIVGFFDLQRPMKAVGSLDTWYKPDGMLLRYLCVPLTARQETRMRDRPAISMENYTIYCGDADENKIVSAHAPTETAEDNNKDAFYDELNALISKITGQQLVIVRIHANVKMRLEQQSEVLGKWYHPMERTSGNGNRPNRRASSSLPRLRGIIDAISSRGRDQTF
ncbi:hypothetical protein RB195_024001 [Necator americanus]|uniref:Uncharacterized protein n=1 Tax=Necator americanus TaxID=51031 RepID=A0ABR1ENT5_NECAM